MSKTIKLHYTGPETREFGGTWGTETFTVPSKADNPAREFEVSQQVADHLLAVTGEIGSRVEGKALFAVAVPDEQEGDGKKQETSEPPTPPVEPPISLGTAGVASSPAEVGKPVQTGTPGGKRG